MKNLYEQIELRFPLVAAVIEGLQDGLVYENSRRRPTHALVMHKFGFCQEFQTKSDPSFFSEISELIRDRQYHKLRMYAPSPARMEFLSSLDFAGRAERLQFDYHGLASGPKEKEKMTGGNFPLRRLRAEDLQQNDFGLDLNSRYWRNSEDFLANSLAVGGFVDQQWAGLCYAAAIGGGRAEVDIMVAEEYRSQGLGTALAVAFAELCRERGLAPNWDCYANNLASIALARKAGFVEKTKYAFYNISGGLH